MGKRDASHFITEYYTECGKVELMIPTDATDDDFALLKDILALVEAKMKQRSDRKTENNSEKPNNCEHITEDGVTCAKYPACDDCLDNPLNKLKGSERLVKGSEQTEPTISKMEQVDKDINVRSKDEPQTDCPYREYPCDVCDEQTDCPWK